MIFSVSGSSVQWSVDFGPDSVILMVKALVQEMAVSSKEVPIAARNLLLQQKQDFMISLFFPNPNTPNQRGTDELLSSVGAQDMDTGGYQVTELEDIEFHWEEPELNLYAVLQTGKDSTSSPSAFNDSEMVSVVENSIPPNDEEEKEIFFLLQKFQSVGDQPDTALVRSCHFWNKNWKYATLCSQKNVSIGITVSLFSYTLYVK